jgi:uncharacterized protein (DUF305 family)
MTARQPVTLALLAACLLAAASGCARTPGDDSAEAGFARDMATHHAQAVEMGFIIRDATTDARLRALAADIIVTQSAQRGMFMSWLQTWGLSQASPGPRMAWMGSGSQADGPGTADAMSGMPHTGDSHTMAAMPLMAGMATDAELEALRHATGREAEVLFLQLMVRHHEGGVLMARALLGQSRRPDVVTLVRGIEAGQMGEINTMTEMLTQRGAQPMPSLLK